MATAQSATTRSTRLVVTPHLVEGPAARPQPDRCKELRIGGDQPAQLTLGRRSGPGEQDVRHAVALEVRPLNTRRRLEHLPSLIHEEVERHRLPAGGQIDERLVVGRQDRRPREGVNRWHQLRKVARNAPRREVPPAVGEPADFVAGVSAPEGYREQRQGDSRPFRNPPPEPEGPRSPRQTQPGQYGPQEPV